MQRVWIAVLASFLAGPIASPARADSPAFLVKDINQERYVHSSWAHDFVPLGDATVFVAWTSSAGTELWRTDGTPGRTVLLRDIQPGPMSSDPTGLTTFEDRLFFTADDGVGGRELWATDGTEEGTVRVRDIRPGLVGSEPSDLTVVDGRLLFVADDGTNGEELWSSDGTEAGTAPVADIRPGPEGSGPRHFAELNGVLMFAADDGVHGTELWSSDGGPDGTRMVKEVYSGPSGSHPFYGGPSSGSHAFGLTVVDGIVMFAAEDGVHGVQLWRSDGTRHGTQLVREIISGGGGNPEGLSLASFFSVGPSLFFTVIDAIAYFGGGPCTFGFTLWTSDGTEEGTVALKETLCIPDISPEAGSVADQFLFSAVDFDDESGLELWKSDGTRSGTALVKDINPEGDARPSELPSFLGDLYFVADDGSHGQELWVSDGTEAGTQLVADLRPGSDGSSPLALAAAGDRLFFNAEDDHADREP